MEKGRIQVYAKKCIKLCKSNCYRVEFSNIQLELKNTFNAEEKVKRNWIGRCSEWSKKGTERIT